MNNTLILQIKSGNFTQKKPLGVKITPNGTNLSWYHP